MLAQRFYASLLCCNLVWWSIVFLSTRRCSKLNGKTRALDRHGLACRPLYAICPMPTVLTRPSWVPTSFVVSLHRFRALLFLAVPLSLYYAAVDELCNTWVRLTTACIFTLYHLCESSATNRYLIASPHLNHSPHANIFAMLAVSALSICLFAAMENIQFCMTSGHCAFRMTWHTPLASGLPFTLYSPLASRS